MKIECYGGSGWEANCYLILDEQEKHALVVDPSVDLHAVFRQRQKPIPPIDAIILTHVHFDHMLAINSWREQTGAPLAVHQADAAALGDGEKNVYLLFTGHDSGTGPAERLLTDGDTLMLGNEQLTVLHTPGHTPGCICLSAPGMLFSGDTLFAGNVGRTDLPGGNKTELITSLGKLSKLPLETKIYPGHGPCTTIEHEKKYNPYVGE